MCCAGRPTTSSAGAGGSSHGGGEGCARAARALTGGMSSTAGRVIEMESRSRTRVCRPRLVGTGRDPAAGSERTRKQTCSAISRASSSAPARGSTRHIADQEGGASDPFVRNNGFQCGWGVGDSGASPRRVRPRGRPRVPMDLCVFAVAPAARPSKFRRCASTCEPCSGGTRGIGSSICEEHTPPLVSDQVFWAPGNGDFFGKTAAWEGRALTCERRRAGLYAEGVGTRVRGRSPM